MESVLYRDRSRNGVVEIALGLANMSSVCLFALPGNLKRHDLVPRIEAPVTVVPAISCPTHGNQRIIHFKEISIPTLLRRTIAAHLMKPSL